MSYKGNYHESEKAICWMGENICKYVSDKGIEIYIHTYIYTQININVYITWICMYIKVVY